MKGILNLWLVFFCLVAFSCGGAQQAPAPPHTVENLDVDRFMGTWYEVARLPFKWQKDCVGSAARYEKVSGEEFEVVNYCWYKTLDGPMRKARAKAVLDTSEKGARAKIQFFWPIWDDFWVIHVSDDYRQTVIGTPDRKTLWLMSRTPDMDTEIYETLVSLAKQEGFDTSRLMKTMQVDPPEYSETPKDEETIPDAGIPGDDTAAEGEPAAPEETATRKEDGDD